MKKKFNSNLYKKEIINLIKSSIEKLKREYPNYKVLTMSITSDFSSGISAVHFDSESFSKNYLQKEKYKEILKAYDDKEYLSYWDIWDILEEDKEIGKKLFDGGHKIGGFPNFTQSDIREVGDYEILLLQIDSEGTEKNEIIWGDCGVANFFIREKDLKELNFEKVIYNWDCC